MKIPKLIKIIISLLILLILIKIVGPEKLLEIILNINLIYIIPVVIIYILTFFIAAWNINILLNGIKTKIVFKKLLRYTIISWSLGLVSPGKIGDFSMVYFLKKEKVKIGSGFGIVLIDKAITLFVLLLFALLTTVILLTKKDFFIVLVIIILAFFGTIIILNKKTREIIRHKILGKYSKNFKGFYKTIEFIIKNNKKELTYNFLVTILKWVISGINVLFIFLGLGASGNLVLITLISASLIIFNLVPITFHGIGLKEAAGIYLYGLIGISGEVVIVTYIIFNILAYSVAAISSYFLAEEIEKIISLRR